MKKPLLSRYTALILAHLLFWVNISPGLASALQPDDSILCHTTSAEADHIAACEYAPDAERLTESRAEKPGKFIQDNFSAEKQEDRKDEKKTTKQLGDEDFFVALFSSPICSHQISASVQNTSREQLHCTAIYLLNCVFRI